MVAHEIPGCFVHETTALADSFSSPLYNIRELVQGVAHGKDKDCSVLSARHVSEASPAGPLLENSRISSRKKTKLWSRFTRFWSGSSANSKGV